MYGVRGRHQRSIAHEDVPVRTLGTPSADLLRIRQIETQERSVRSRNPAPVSLRGGRTGLIRTLGLGQKIALAD